MTRSHPPTLLTTVERTLREECRLERGARILVAVSGGGDSQALLHALARLASRLGIGLAAHGVDHGLREESARELDLAEDLAGRFSVPFSRSRVAVDPGGNLMARAREARYRELGAAAKRHGASLIATAHHADDRAETVLMRLLRGAGPRGLAVLAPRSGELLRPMVRARRTDVQAHLARHEIHCARDPSNLNRRFLRVRVRLELLPLLEELSPQVVDHLCALADQLAGSEAPALLDGAGQPVALGRAQAGQLERLIARRLLRGTVRLAGNRLVRLAPGGLSPVVEPGGGARPRRGAAKTPKSD